MQATESTITTNEETVRRVYQALGAADFDTIRALFTPDTVTHIPGRNPLSGDLYGVEALIEYFGKLFERSEGSFRVELQQVVANETRAAGVHHETATRGRKALDTQLVVVFRLVEGRVAEARVHYYDQTVADAFWS